MKKTSSNRMELNVVRKTETATLPNKAHRGDLGFDVYSDEDITLQPGEDREFKNQFKEYLQKNMRMDEPVKKEKKPVKKKKKATSSKFFA